MVYKSKKRSVLGEKNLRISDHPVNIILLKVYAAPVDVAEEEVDRFYEMVEEVLDKIPELYFKYD